MNFNDESFWYVFYTYPRSEKIADNELRQNKYEAFLPVRQELKVWKNRQKKIIDRVLFPGYIFVKTRISELYKIIRLSKIVSYVKYDGNPARISQKEIEGIRIMLDIHPDISVEPVFVENEKVKIISGPLAGYEGIICMKRGRKRFGIQIEAINRVIFIEADVNDLNKRV
jgi:transcription antitermination factor NusG